MKREDKMAVRTIVKINEELCDGCGLCVPGCAEGALQIIDGKAKLVSEVYCDGLGACLGECPQGAITMIEREAEEFDEEAMKKHLDNLAGSGKEDDHGHDHGHDHGKGHGDKQAAEPSLCGCPGSMSQSFDKPKQSPPPAPVGGDAQESGPVASRLGNWPVQIMLAPVNAPYFDGARLVIAADCAPFAYADFHRRFLEGKTLLIGCPKLDDTDVYVQKLTEIFKQNNIASVDVVYMEVPCCTGLTQLTQEALERSGKQIPTTLNRVGIKGDFVEERILDGAAA
jgi:NAD-dependent dihydropyrimidine dehydrogenase PreA subunit